MFSLTLKPCFYRKFHSFHRNEERIFFDSLASKLKIKHWQEWYSITPQDIRNHGGNEGLQILTKYGNSVLKALSKNYSENNWDLCRYSHVPPSFWTIIINQRYFLDQISTFLNFSSWENWYTITSQDLVLNGGKGLIDAYNGCIFSAITNIYSEFKWEPWQFKNIKIPDEYWNSSTFRFYFDSLAKHLNYKEISDFYNIKRRDIEEFGGIFIIERYFGNSISKAIIENFSDYDWKPWLFSHLQVSKGYWENRENVESYIKWLGSKFRISSTDDWKQITSSLIVANGGKTLLETYGGLSEFLAKFVLNSSSEEEIIDTSLLAWKRKQMFTKSQGTMSSLLHQIVISSQINKK